MMNKLLIVLLALPINSYAFNVHIEDIRTMEANNSRPVVRIKREWHEVIDPKSPEGIRLIAKPKSVFVPVPVKPTLNKLAPPKKTRVAPTTRPSKPAPPTRTKVAPTTRPNKPAPRANTKVAPEKRVQQKPPSGCTAMVADFRAKKAKKQLSALESFELAQRIGVSCPKVGASLFQ